jgi:hypothetical protein
MAIHEFAHVVFALVVVCRILVALVVVYRILVALVVVCRILVAARTELVGDGENGVDSAGTLERISIPELCFPLVAELHDQR